MSTLVKLCNIFDPVLHFVLFLSCIFLYFRNLAVSVRIIKFLVPQCLFSMLWWHCSQPDLLQKCTKRYDEAFTISKQNFLISADSGATVITAVRVLLEHGVKEENILLLNVFATPKGENPLFVSQAEISKLNGVCLCSFRVIGHIFQRMTWTF